MDKQTQEYYEKIDRAFKSRLDAFNNYEPTEVIEVFTHAYKAIINFYFMMEENERSKEVLYDMFGKASEAQLDGAHRLLVFWFLWQRDWARGLNFLKSEKIRDGLKRIWSFNESEINNLTQELNSEQEKGLGGETLCLWQKLQSILGNNKWSPLFVFPALSAALKVHWARLDSTVGDNI